MPASERLRKKRLRREEEALQKKFQVRKRQKLTRAENPLELRSEAWFEVRQTMDAPNGLQLLFDEGVQFKAEKFQENHFWTVFCMRASFQDYELKGKITKTHQKHTHFPSGVTAVVMQRLFNAYLLARNAKQIEWQENMLNFLIQNTRKRDFVLAECLETFIAFSDHVAELKILKLITEVARPFENVNDIRIVVEALLAKNLPNEAFLFVLGLLWSKCQKKLDPSVYTFKFLDPEDKEKFGKGEPSKIDLIVKIQRLYVSTPVKIKKPKRDLLTQLMVLVGRLVPNSDDFLDKLQRELSILSKITGIRFDLPHLKEL